MNSLKELKLWIEKDLKLLGYEHKQILDKIEEIENNK